MKIYVWQNEITSAYHDDGTIVVLAESVEEARKLVRERYPIGDRYAEVDKRFEEKEPDQVLDLDKPTFVAFNYGGDD